MSESQTPVKPVFRMAHTMIRVGDLDRSLDFYTRMPGMRLLRQSEYPDGKFTNVFVGYSDEATDAVIELTYNWKQSEPYELGNGWGHLALEVPDVHATCEKLQREGVRITGAPGPMKHGTRVIAFIEDPDGYKIELLEPN
ncbi:MAG: lactoylglutathione lyase [Gammaproteobacteria bacterium]|nr:lactoylglutathione lyase [Gammaproteobacteria bacterium]